MPLQKCKKSEYKGKIKMDNILNSIGHELKFSNFVRAENCTLFDDKGDRYLDLESGVWSTPVGHCHPRITQVLSEQSGKMIHSGYCYLNPIVGSAASKILEITGIKTGKCVFLCSGSEAVEFSVQLISKISSKPYFLTMKNCYLSAYGISGERSGNRWIHFDWMNEGNTDKIDFSKIAAFVFEPGSSLGLVHFPPKELIQQIVNRVRECGGYVITNEVTTGTGRTGRWFGYNHFDIIPDIVAIGKGLGNGYPVSCVAIAESVTEKIDPKKFHYGQSHQNDPLGAAVALGVIDVIEKEGLLQRAVTIGEKIRCRFNRMKDEYGIIKEVRGRGLMIAVEFQKNDGFSFAEKINEELLKRNVILAKRPGHEVFRIDPALTIQEEQVEYFLCTIEEIISSLRVQS